ncbi:hypothetical protein [uncultured Rikenella sp.]|uniref:hypothetical protein n=1 Tax=uncultured Rikenella sp. TaxID=368003 RepID=UPI0025FB93F3|nr:hypothetical protein [uncultured Rikenella sp.]
MLNRVDSHGFSWSAATNGIRGMDLSFDPQGLYANGSDGRGHGFQLRCLSE